MVAAMVSIARRLELGTRPDWYVWHSGGIRRTPGAE